ncbi:MAG: branched-chain amino acid aminotransferase [Pseudomonadota bacterium]|jgi:branched-chain amino acid aminotransferase
MSLIPFDDRDGVIWMDGEFVPWREAKLHVLTHGLHYASSVFEGERLYNGEIFELTWHSQRLKRSAELLGMEIPYSVEQIDAACQGVCARMGFTDAYVRPVAWRGSEQMSVAAPEAKIHLAVAAWEWPSYFDPEVKKKGIRLTNAAWSRPAPHCAPTEAKAAGLYMICTLSKHAAEKAGYADALMLDYRGYVAEATGANIFFVKDGAIHTPLPDCFLNGITRQTVIKIARACGFEVIERHIKPEELPSFSECFLTGSAAEVTPVSEIGEHRFTPGNLSLSLMDDYARFVRREVSLADLK